MTCIGTINGTAIPSALPKFIGEKVFEKRMFINGTVPPRPRLIIKIEINRG